MPRIVSLIPSASEIVCALGFEKSLVGRSHECDYPPEIAALPVLTAPKINPEGQSLEIDRQVKGILQNALSVYRVDADQLSLLRPDLIVTQSQCEVCAVSIRDVEQALSQWLGGTRPAIVSLAAVTLEDVFTDISRVATALDATLAGAILIAELRGRVETVAKRARGLATRPAVACVEWIQPLMAAGNWMPELVELAGGWNLFGQAGQHSPWLEFHQLIKADPEVILVAPCGFGIDRSFEQLPRLTGLQGWSDLQAVKAGRVLVADGNQYFNRPGPRLVDSLEIMAEIIHPEAFDFGYQGRGWRPYSS